MVFLLNFIEYMFDFIDKLKSIEKIRILGLALLQTLAAVENVLRKIKEC